VVWDPLIRSIRRFFIKRFLGSDAARLDGTRYNPHGLIDHDRDLADYLWWLADVSHGRPARDRPDPTAHLPCNEHAATSARPSRAPGRIFT
jgi:hypothetical protein